MLTELSVSTETQKHSVECLISKINNNHYETSFDEITQCLTKQNKTKQNKTKQNRTKPAMTARKTTWKYKKEKESTVMRLKLAPS